MKYCDLHCDALTAREKRQVTRQALSRGGCLLQCFAAFIAEREGRFARACALADEFDRICRDEGYNPVRRFSDIQPDKINAMLTVEEGGAVEGDLKKLEFLYERGVRMMTLMWNHPNEIGYPNFPDYEGLFTGRTGFSARETRRLAPFGFELVARMQQLGMIIDAAHASDGVFADVARESKKTGIPFCVSHTAAASVLDCARNITDGQIKTVADCGGVVGLYFCADFLSEDLSEEGQRAAIMRHAKAILNAGGEEVLSLGSDFDGIPPNPYLQDPSCLPKLYDDFTAAFGTRVADKIFSENALEFFSRIL